MAYICRLTDEYVGRRPAYIRRLTDEHKQDLEM
jgi:hypothetical protein